MRSKSKSRFVLAAVPWLTLPYDSLTHLIGFGSEISQTMPLTALISFPYLFFRGTSLRTCQSSRRVGALLITSAVTIFIVTLINIVIENSIIIDADTSLRGTTVMRQGISLCLGLFTFFMIQDSVLRIGLPMAMRWTVIGGLPTLLIAALQLAYGYNRIQGFSSEPSHLADILVWSFLPACSQANILTRSIRWTTAMIAYTVLLCTFSSTGYLKALAVLTFYYLFKKNVMQAIVALILISGIAYFTLYLFPDNYASNIISDIYDGYQATGSIGTGSFIDRFYGFVGPISLLSDPNAWLGFGLGGDSVYFKTMYSPEIAEAILDVKGAIPSISSLQGKMLMYGGVVGYTLYLSAWIVAWRAAPKDNLSRIILPALYFSSLFSIAPFFLPYIWLWLAVSATAANSNYTIKNVGDSNRN